jgi:hypothetical protein
MFKAKWYQTLMVSKMSGFKTKPSGFKVALAEFQSPSVEHSQK